MPFSERIYNFFSTLQFPIDTPEGVEVLNPYQNPQTLATCAIFWNRFYASENRRVSVWGINPGRFGGGITGIAFTDPLHIHKNLNLPAPVNGASELSAQFIGNVVEKFGGAQKFYSSLYLSSLCPLGFIKEGKNYNFYDDKQFTNALEPFIQATMETQLLWDLRRDVAVCLGKGKLYSYFERLNKKYEWFEKIYTIEHPRFIMQYRRKRQNEYIDQYVRLFSSIV